MAELTIRPLAAPEAVAAGARMMAASDPWITLGRGEAACRALLERPGLEAYGAWWQGGLVGVLVLNLQGPFPGYLQAICVDPTHRSRGLGADLVAFAEARVFQEHPNVFLCVSGFNARARAFYARLGYREVGELPDFVVAGQSEVLLRKTRGPRDGYRP